MGVLDRQHANGGGGGQRRGFATTSTASINSTRLINKHKLNYKTPDPLLSSLKQLLADEPDLNKSSRSPRQSPSPRHSARSNSVDRQHTNPTTKSTTSAPLAPPSIDFDLSHLATPRPWNPSLADYSRLEPGSFVDVRRGGLPLSGIYLGPAPPTDTGAHLTRDHQILASNGAFVGVLPEDVTLSLPFADASLARRANQDGVQSDAARSLWQLQRRFEFAFERRTKELVERGAKDVYRIIQSDPGPSKVSASSQPKSSPARRAKPATITTNDALGHLLSGGALPSTGESDEWSLMDHLVMHNILMASEDQFVADPVAHRTTGKFTVRPTDELNELNQIREWVRTGGKDLDTFVDESVAAIKFGQANQSRGATDQLATATVQGPAWSPSSLRLLNFLKQAATGSSRLIQPNPYLAITPAILKAVNAKLNPTINGPSISSSPLTSTDINSAKAAATSVPLGSELDVQDMSRERILAFLADVGAVAGWEDWVAHESQDLREWEANECTKDQMDDSRPKPSKNGVLDPHDAVRHDFAKLAVYTIDDPGALELDDGISIERVSASPAQYWIHAHIADPTTIIAPGSPMGLMAQQRNNTEYFPERTWAMLPHDFIEHNNLSLGSGGGGGQKTLTISARIDDTGEVFETIVRAGVVNNVKRLTYGAVDKLLGYDRPSAGPTLYHPLDPTKADNFNIGSTTPARQTDDAILGTDSTALADLTLLHTLATALIGRRTKDDALYWHMPRASPTVTGDITHHYDIPTSPTFYTQSPVISLPLASPIGGADRAPAPQSTPAQLVVSEMMILANRSAARFAAERGLALPFVSQPKPDVSDDQLAAILALRNPHTGEARGEDVLKQGIEFSRSEVGLEPKPHWPMGIKDQFGYVRVTSPLRRFGDLLGHWQLKSALLNGGQAKAAFDKTQVGQMIATMNDIGQRRGKIDRHANAFWAAYLLRAKHRALASGGPGPRDELAEEVLASLTAIALRAPLHSIGDGRWLQQCLVKEVGMMGQVWMGSLAEGLAVGEEGRVELVKVVVGGRSRLIVRRT